VDDNPQAVNVRQLLDLTGRVAMITGGSMGLGRQMAEGLAEMGANLVLCARKKERCESAAEELKGARRSDCGARLRRHESCEHPGRRGGCNHSVRANRYLINNAGNFLGSSRGRNASGAMEQGAGNESDRHVLMFAGRGQGQMGQKRGKIINVASIAGNGFGSPPELQAIGYSAKQGRRDHFYARPGTKMGQSQYSRECHRSRLVSHAHVGRRH